MLSKKKLDKPKKGKSSRKIRRECETCGKKIYATVYNDGHYKGGHFFGKIDIPKKDTGKYKIIGKQKLPGGEKIDVVEWTGQDETIEYWECDDCYEEKMHEFWLRDKIEELYGNRCADHETDCPCCQVWDVYDTIIKEARTDE